MGRIVYRNTTAVTPQGNGRFPNSLCLGILMNISEEGTQQ